MSGIVWLSTDGVEPIAGQPPRAGGWQAADATTTVAGARRVELSPAHGLAWCAAVSLIVTLLIAWPVVSSPSTRLFGTEVVGRQHDPFTVMWQFEHGPPASPYRQPLVDDVGAWLGRAVGPVAAFNAIVLASFPLTAVATYALARYLALSHVGALVAALAFAFAPPHVAHAAYHPHVAQTQWIPLFLLALWSCLDYVTWRRAGFLVLAIAALTLSNFYGGFIGAIVAPVAAAAYWMATPARRLDSLLATASLLALVAVTGAVAAWYYAPSLFNASSQVPAPIDVIRHGAWWRAYAAPPIDHAITGAIGARLWAGTGIGTGLLEQQLSVSWALLALAGWTLWTWCRTCSTLQRGASSTRVAVACTPVLVCLGAWAAWCSLAPGAGVQAAVPASWLHPWLPMFRAYARFGLVTHLMIALLAGVAISSLRAGGEPRHPGLARRVGLRPLALLLLVCAAFEYAPIRWRSRDILPTAAHRWLAEQPLPMRVLDCVRPDADSALLPWLMHRDVTFLSSAVATCEAPGIAPMLAALGYTHILARDAVASGVLPEAAATTVRTWPRELALLQTFSGMRVFAVTARPAPVVIADIRGFYEAESRGDDRWQWLGQHGEWVVRNTTARTLDAQLDMTLTAFARPRHLTLTLGARPPETLQIPSSARRFRLNLRRLSPGDHRLTFEAREPATHAGAVLRNGDARRLTMMFERVRWLVASPLLTASRGIP